MRPLASDDLLRGHFALLSTLTTSPAVAPSLYTSIFEYLKSIQGIYYIVVFVHKPTIITLTFGMNDTGYGEYLRENAKEFADKRVQQSFASYQLIEKKLQNYTGARKMMIASLRGLDDVVIDEAGSGLEAVERLALGPVDMLFLDLTARQDKSSTLPKANNAFFYPSAALGFVFSEMVLSASPRRSRSRRRKGPSVVGSVISSETVVWCRVAGRVCANIQASRKLIVAWS